jgi:DNA-binding GntR family transcriptional regulator
MVPKRGAYVPPLSGHRRFHEALIDAAGNELIARTRRVRVGIAALSRTDDRRHQVCVEHRRIVEGLTSGDEVAAHQAIDEHLPITLRQFLEA